MAKTKAVLTQNGILHQKNADFELQIDELNSKIQSLSTVKDSDIIKALEKQIEHLKIENDELDAQNKTLQEEKEAKQAEYNEQALDDTINKFKEFWDFILMENQTVLNNLDKNIPNFRSLFTKLDQREKTKFKPILQIVAHSLQFLKKIVTLDESYNFLQKDYKNFVSTTNTTVDMISGSESSKLEMLEKQLSIMQEE